MAEIPSLKLKALLDEKTTFLFDMDGTLLNSEPFHIEAIIQCANEIGVPEGLCADEFLGKPDELIYKTTPIQEYTSLDNFLYRKNELYTQVIESADIKTYLVPGVLDFLEELVRRNKKIAVVSASEHYVIESTLQKMGIQNKVAFFISASCTDRSKPHPDPYLEAMRRFGTNPVDTVIFEDSPIGLAAALDSGALVCQMTCFSDCANKADFEIADYCWR